MALPPPRPGRRPDAVPPAEPGRAPAKGSPHKPTVAEPDARPDETAPVDDEVVRRRAAWLAREAQAERRRERVGELGAFFWPTTTRRLSKPKAVAVLVFNIFPPGLGTVLYGKWERGVAQFLLAFVIVGWAWAILDGIRVVRRAWQGGPSRRPDATRI